MSIQVKSIDVYAIHERLRKDKSKEGKETWNYVKRLNEALERQKELTGLAISKLRKPEPESPSLSVPIDQEGRIELEPSELKSTGGYKKRIIDLFKKFPIEDECSVADILYRLQTILNEYADQERQKSNATPSQPSWVSVLKELVELKDIEEQINPSPLLIEQYLIVKPLAWEAARELLKSVKKSNK